MSVWLKSLEVQGFKSFPDKTLLQFGSDITAIVGPNGSGKSNISDAISWVLGEQSSKALRGAKMEDVIFGGTQKRPAVGFAEATLILDNSDGSFRIETPEVMITRRYYRSGESEYYINKQQARLREINELFMDTGLGKEGYSNIGQGRIDEILAVKSTDRREIFEEAAGISKYRHRKEETERRLASTEDNLLRIGDKISELELQIEPLREQAQKAQKYLTLRAELKGLEVTLWLDNLQKIAAEAKKAEEDYTSAAFVLEQAHDELNNLYAQSEQLSMQLNRDSLRLDIMREEIAAGETERAGRENEIALLQAGVENAEQNILRVQQEISEQENRSGGIAEKIREQQEKIQELLDEQARLQQRLGEAVSQAEALCGSADQSERNLLSVRSQKALAQSDLAARQTEMASLGASLNELFSRKAALEEDHAAAAARQQQTQTQQLESRKKLEQAKEDARSAQNIISGYELRLQSRLEKKEQLRRQADAEGVQLDTTEAKIRMLREMEREFEGFSKSVKLVMQEAERGGLRGIHGPISKLVQVEDEYTTAIETALGAAMQNIVVDSEEDGKAAIQMLKRRDAGRATFLPISAIRAKRMECDDLSRMTGFVGVASELVKADQKYRSIVESLLGRTVITENLDQAIRMARQTGSRFRIVTLDGQVMNAGGSMTGGSASKSAGVLSRANELQRLCTQREALAQKLEQTRSLLQQAQSSAAKTEFELTAERARLREAEDEVLRRTEEEKQIGLLCEALRHNLDSYESETAELMRRQSEQNAKLDMLKELEKELQSRLSQLDAQEQTLAAGQSELNEQSQKLAEQITDLRMQAAARQAEQTGMEQTVAQLQALSQAMQGDRSRKQELIAQYRSEIEELHRQTEQKRGELCAADKAVSEKKAALQTAVEEKNLLEGKRNRTEKQAQEKNKDILLLERECARLEQKKTTGELEEKQLVDKLWDTYELTPGTAQNERVELESAAAANRRIGEVRRRISALGTVNLGAVEEYERVSERYSYLAGQRDDVLHAKTELEQIVQTIVTEMTDIFTREFARINEHFGKTFTEMFGGGKGSLELEDAAHPLECGIEIRVQPPGKQLKTITLLSGGEKAFVAIALYFAILRVRPTPFCMLDEIDAALDDRNVERFASYLRNLCGNTQFIVITHRRGTMEASDILYGVTMQEQGVSKILHLNLDEMTKKLGIEA